MATLAGKSVTVVLSHWLDPVDGYKNERVVTAFRKGADARKYANKKNDTIERGGCGYEAYFTKTMRLR